MRIRRRSLPRQMLRRQARATDAGHRGGEQLVLLASDRDRGAAAMTQAGGCTAEVRLTRHRHPLPVACGGRRSEASDHGRRGGSHMRPALHVVVPADTSSGRSEQETRQPLAALADLSGNRKEKR